MISLLAAIATGYALGTFIQHARLPYLLCPPISVAVYLLVTFLLAGFASQGVVMPAPEVLIAAVLIQTPVLWLGVFLARRKAARAGYDA